jgi:hypothetical protein
MAHPQSTNRGYQAFKRVDVGAMNIQANSTALLLSGALSVSGVSAKTITANSTGIRIGSLYISCNSTGNTTT